MKAFSTRYSVLAALFRALILSSLLLFTVRGSIARQSAVPDTVIAVSLDSLPGFWMTRPLAEDYLSLQRLAPAMQATLASYRQTAARDTLVIKAMALQSEWLRQRLATLNAERTLWLDDRTALTTVSDSWQSMYRREQRRRIALIGTVVVAVAAGILLGK